MVGCHVVTYHAIGFRAGTNHSIEDYIWTNQSIEDYVWTNHSIEDYRSTNPAIVHCGTLLVQMTLLVRSLAGDSTWTSLSMSHAFASAAANHAIGEHSQPTNRDLCIQVRARVPRALLTNHARGHGVAVALGDQSETVGRC